MDPEAVGVIGVLLTLGLLFAGAMYMARKMQREDQQGKLGAATRGKQSQPSLTICAQCKQVLNPLANFCSRCGKKCS